MSDGEIIGKLQQLRTYIPFVERMIKKLEPKTGSDKQEYLDKLRGLHGFLTSNPDARRISYDTLLKMEKIIKGMYESAGRGTNTASGSYQGSSDGKSYSRDTPPSSFSRNKFYTETAHMGSHAFQGRRLDQVNSALSGRAPVGFDPNIVESSRSKYGSNTSGRSPDNCANRRNVDDVDLRSMGDSQFSRHSHNFEPFSRSRQNSDKERSFESNYRNRDYDERVVAPDYYTKDFDERALYQRSSYKAYDNQQRKSSYLSPTNRSEPSSSQSSGGPSDIDYIRKERSLFGEDIFGNHISKRAQKLEPQKPKRTLLDLPMPPVKPFNPREYMFSKQHKANLHEKISEHKWKYDSKSDKSLDPVLNHRKARFSQQEASHAGTSNRNTHIPESQLRSEMETVPEKIKGTIHDSNVPAQKTSLPSTTLTADTPQSPEIEAKFSPSSNEEEEKVMAIPLEKKPTSMGNDFPKDIGLMENIKKAVNFFAEKPGDDAVSKTTFRCEDFVGPAARREGQRTSNVVEDTSREGSIFGSEDMDLRKTDVDLRQIPKPLYPTTAVSSSKSSSASRWSSDCSVFKDVDMRSFTQPKSASVSQSSTSSVDHKKDSPPPPLSREPVGVRVAHDSDKLIKVGKKGLAATQMDNYKQKRDANAVSKIADLKGNTPSKGAQVQVKTHKPISVLDELIPIDDKLHENTVSQVIKPIQNITIPVGKHTDPSSSPNSSAAVTNTELLKKPPLTQQLTVTKEQLNSKVDAIKKTLCSTDSPATLKGSDLLSSVADLPSVIGRNRISKSIDGTPAIKDPRSVQQAENPRNAQTARDSRSSMPENINKIDHLSRDPRSSKTADIKNIHQITARDPRFPSNEVGSERKYRYEGIGTVKQKDILSNAERAKLRPNTPLQRPPLQQARWPIQSGSVRNPFPRPPMPQNEPRFSRPPFPRPPHTPVLRPLLSAPANPRLTRAPFTFQQNNKNSQLAESYTCVILKGLPPYANSRNIYRFFEYYLLRDLCIVLDNSLNCKGEAYVHFASHKDAEDALNTLSGSFIDDYRIFIGMCSVGILKQAKNTYGQQSFERERILKIPQKPGAMNWNPFYKAKPVAEVVAKPPVIDQSASYSSPIDRPQFNLPDVNPKGYSNMCGVKLSSQHKDIKSFKIPKVKKPVAEKVESNVNVTTVESIPESTCEPIANEAVTDKSSPSDDDDLIDIVPLSKKNRRYRKIRHVIASDSDSDASSPESPPRKLDKTASLSATVANQVKPVKNKLSVKKNVKEKFQLSSAIKKNVKQTSQEPVRRGRSQLDKVHVEKKPVKDMKKTRQTAHTEVVNVHEITVIVPVPENMVTSLVDLEKVNKPVCAKRRGRGRGQKMAQPRETILPSSILDDGDSSSIIPEHMEDKSSSEDGESTSIVTKSNSDDLQFSTLQKNIDGVKTKTDGGLHDEKSGGLFDNGTISEIKSQTGSQTLTNTYHDICSAESSSLAEANSNTKMNSNKNVKTESPANLKSEALSEPESQNNLKIGAISETLLENKYNTKTGKIYESKLESDLNSGVSSETKSQSSILRVNIPDAESNVSNSSTICKPEASIDSSSRTETKGNSAFVGEYKVETKEQNCTENSTSSKFTSESSRNKTLSDSSAASDNLVLCISDDFDNLTEAKSEFSSITEDSFSKRVIVDSQSGINPFNESDSSSVIGVIKVKHDTMSNVTEVKHNPIRNDTEAKQDPISNATEGKQDPISNAAEVKHDPISNATEVKEDLVSNTTEDKQDLVSNTTEDKQDLVSKNTEDKQDIVSNNTEEKQKLVDNITEDKQVPISNNTEEKQNLVDSITEDKQVPISNAANKILIGSTIANVTEYSKDNQSVNPKYKDGKEIPATTVNKGILQSDPLPMDVYAKRLPEEVTPFNSKCEVERNQVNKFLSISPERSVFDKDDDFDLPELTQITPSISNVFGLYDDDITALSDLNKEPFIAADKNKPLIDQLIDKTDQDNINEISDQLVKSANEFTMSLSMERAADTDINSTVESDEENDFSNAVDAIVDSLTNTSGIDDALLPTDSKTVMTENTIDGISEPGKEVEEISQNNEPEPSSDPTTTTVDNCAFKDQSYEVVPEIVITAVSSEQSGTTASKSENLVSSKATPPVSAKNKCKSKKTKGKKSSLKLSKADGEVVPDSDSAVVTPHPIKTRIVRKGADWKLAQSASLILESKRATRSCRSQNDSLNESPKPNIVLRSPTLLLKDIRADIGQKSDTVVEISDDETSIGNDSSLSLADDDSFISGEGRQLGASPLPPRTPTPNSKKGKREKRTAVVSQKKRITRGSMVIPEIKESILWDDGGVVDLFLCDQCDYVGKQQVFHLINFHSEREIPCVFRKEDFSPVLRDAVGPPELGENCTPLNICWIPAQMVFDEEIECQESDCDYYSSSRFDFIYHLLEHNPECINTFFHCRLCNYMSNDLTAFYDHVTSHTGEYRHMCLRCCQRFFSLPALELHHLENHDSQEKEFSSDQPLLEDNWPYIYVCKACQYAQISKEKCEEHIQKKHSGKADVKRANMTRQIKVWGEEKKENEISPGPKIPITSIKADTKKAETLPVETNVAIDSDEKLTPVVPKKEPVDDIPEKPILDLVSACDQSVFFGNESDLDHDTQLPSSIASNLTIKRPTDKAKLNDSVMSNILKFIEETKNSNFSDTADVAMRDEEEFDPLSYPKKLPTEMSSPVVPDIATTSSTDTTFQPGTKRPFSSLIEAGVVSPISRRESASKESSDESDTLVIDEDSDAVRTPIRSLSKEEEQNRNSVTQEPEPKFMKTASGERSTIDAGANDQAGFLRIESCITLAPTTPSNTCSNRGIGLGQPTFGSPSSVIVPAQEKLSPVTTTGQFISMKSVEGADESSRSKTLSSLDSHSGPSIPGADVLPDKGPTVPLFHIFCKYQLSKIFFAYISNLACMVFKCMTLGCSFTSDSAAAFETHLSNHSVPQLRCCYCLTTKSNYGNLIQHILLEHSHCAQQCQYCPYRAHSRIYIGVHLKKFHPDKESRFMKVNTIRSVPPPCPAIENFVYPYKCTFPKCTFKTVDSSCFNNHVKTHTSVDQLSCYICSFSTANLQLVEHMKTHQMNEFQCPYCLFGAEERERLLTHLLNLHPGRNGKVLLRKQEVAPPPTIDLAIPETDPLAITRQTSTDSDSSNLSAVRVPSAGVSSPYVASPSQGSAENFLLDGTGLTGHTLYRCGNERCDLSCPTQALLKEHLHICDFSRDSPLLKCFHCFKSFRHMSGLLDHIKVHGPKRYSCGATGCDYRGPLPHYFKNHMKQVHHSSSFKIVPKDFTNKDPETQRFVVYPKDAVTFVKEPHKKRKNEYAVEDIDKIPRSHVCYNDLKCYHCPYTSKIRLNLIKHLKLHQRQPAVSAQPAAGFVPIKQPVNPVPRLERKELMFDKMKNLAGSSYEESKAIETAELRSKHPIPDEELATIPAYVPETKINQCGIEDCKYQSCGEVMLKYHINTLHPQNESWLCPHCPNYKLTVDKIGAHFKLHGPRLHRCGWCSFLSIRLAMVERHMKEKHVDKRPFSFPIRMTETDDIKDEDANETTIKQPVEPEMQWQCGLCIFRSVTQQDMMNHTSLKHDMKSQYKCGYCNVRSSVKASFDTHFASKHPNKDFRVLCIFYRLDSDDIVPVGPSGKSVGHEPLWRRNDPDRPKQMGGILIDDKSDKELSVLDIEPGEPFKNEFVCPKCHSFKSPFINIFKPHLCKEANYQRFECVDCGITSPLLPTIRRHYTKTHGNSFTTDCYINLPVESHLEAWVDSIISYQEHRIKLWMDGGIEVKSEQKMTSASASSSRRTSSSHDLLSPEAGTSGKVLHSSGTKFACDTCGMECRTTSGLKHHISTMHQMKFKCKYCPFSSNLEAAVVQHCSSKHPSWNKEAIVLSKETASDGCSKSPTKGLFAKKKYECPFCDAVLLSYKLLVRHKKTHSAGQYLCQYCYRRFKSKGDGNCHSTKKHAGLEPRIVFEESMEATASGSEVDSGAVPLETVTPQDPPSPAIGPIAPESEYSCCHCSTVGSMLVIQEHMKVSHRELPYLVRKKTTAGLFVEVHRFTCGHCHMQNVTLLEAMNHWLKAHVAQDFSFSVTLLSSNQIEAPRVDTESDASPTKEAGGKGIKRKISHDSMDSQQKSPKRRARASRKPQLSHQQSETIEDNATNQVSSSTSDAPVDMVIKCGYCPLTFTTNAATVKHIKQVHGENKPIKMQMMEKDEYEKSHKGIFECNHCGETGAIDEIHSHTVTAHPQLVASFKKITKPSAVSAKQLFVCKFCGHSLKSKRAVEYHILNKHQHMPSSTDAYFVKSVSESPARAGTSSGDVEPVDESLTESLIRCDYCCEVSDSVTSLRDHNAFLHSHLPLKYSVVESGSVPVAGKKNTARKSFATATKRQYATKSTGGRLQISHRQEVSDNQFSAPEVYLDYAEMDES